MWPPHEPAFSATISVAQQQVGRKELSPVTARSEARARQSWFLF
jgi:hypothetical protein